MSEEATKKSETTTGSSPAAADGGSNRGSGGTAASRPTSYFSSISSNDYRAGWDAVFGAAKTRRQTAAKPRRSAVRATIELDPSELDAELRQRLETAQRSKARTRRIAFDEGATNWRLICEFQG